MRVFVVNIAIISVLFGTCFGRSCPRFSTEDNGSCYWVIPNGSAGLPPIDGFQQAANAMCNHTQPGAGLVTINTAEENQFLHDWVTSFTPEPQPVWIGLYRPVNALRPRWISGELGINNMEEPLDEGEGAVLFEDLTFVPSLWEGEDPFELGSDIYALCEYKLPVTPGETTATPTTIAPRGDTTQGDPTDVPIPFQPGPGHHFYRRPVFGGIIKEILRPNRDDRSNFSWFSRRGPNNQLEVRP